MAPAAWCFGGILLENQSIKSRHGMPRRTAQCAGYTGERYGVQVNLLAGHAVWSDRKTVPIDRCRGRHRTSAMLRCNKSNVATQRDL